MHHSVADTSTPATPTQALPMPPDGTGAVQEVNEVYSASASAPATAPSRIANRKELLTRLKNEDTRYRTFYPNFPRFNDFLSPRDLAKAGFFYYNDEDKVQCAFCLGIVGQWESGDAPRSEHSRHFPHCPFVLNLPVGNIPSEATGSATGGANPQRVLDRPVSETRSPVGSSSPSRFQQQEPVVLNQGFDVAGLGRREIRTDAVPERGRGLPARPTRQASASMEMPSSARVVRLSPTHQRSVEELGVRPNKPAKHSDMSHVSSRTGTFYQLKWPSALRQRPHELAEAGFFYTGKSDSVTCYHCGIKLESWAPTDEPWEEHAKWQPECQFVILSKGIDFIDKTKEKAAKARYLQFTHTQEFKELAEMGVDPEKMKAVVSKWYFQHRPLSQWTTSALIQELNDMNMDLLACGEASGVSPGVQRVDLNTSRIYQVVNEPQASEDVGEKKKNGEDSKRPDAVTCKVCLDSEVQVVFLPCGHLCACSKCALVVKNCPICRGPIEAFVRTYIS